MKHRRQARGQRPFSSVLFATLFATLVVAMSLAGASPVGAKGPSGGSGASGPAVGPESYTVDAMASPVYMELALPTVVPLDILVGVDYSAVKIDNQPYVTSVAAPLYLPLLGALPILLGTGGTINDLLTKLLPAVLVGLPTIIGGKPFPIDPATLPLPDLPDLSKVPFDKASCLAYFPGDPRKVACGGTLSGLVSVKQASGQADTSGDPDDRASITANTATKVTGLGSSLLPISVGSLTSSVTSAVVDGKVTVATKLEMLDVNLLGLFSASRISSSSVATLGGVPGSGAGRSDTCEISRAKVAGRPVEIDPAGVRATGVGPGDADVGAAQVAIDGILSLLGVKIRPGRVTPTEISPEGTSLVTGVDCFELSWSNAKSGSRARVAIGQNRITLSATPPAEEMEPSGPPGASPGGLAYAGHDLRDVYPFFAAFVIGIPFLARARSVSLRRR